MLESVFVPDWLLWLSCNLKYMTTTPIKVTNRRIREGVPRKQKINLHDFWKQAFNTVSSQNLGRVDTDTEVIPAHVGGNTHLRSRSDICSFYERRPILLLYLPRTVSSWRRLVSQRLLAPVTNINGVESYSCGNSKCCSWKTIRYMLIIWSATLAGRDDTMLLFTFLVPVCVARLRFASLLSKVIFSGEELQRFLVMYLDQDLWCFVLSERDFSIPSTSPRVHCVWNFLRILRL